MQGEAVVIYGEPHWRSNEVLADFDVSEINIERKDVWQKLDLSASAR